jgi:tetratricopeptide (TPR) repeat protein
LAAYQKALALEPENVQIKHAIARYYLAQGAVADAEEQVIEILTSRPNNYPARLLKAEILAHQRKFDPAIKILDQLIKEDPQNARAYYYKGFSHFGKGEFDFAKQALALAIERQPTFSNAQLLLAEIYLREGDVNLAQKEAQEVLKRQPVNYQAKLILGNAYMTQKELKLAQDAFESMIEMAPDNPVGYSRLGLLQRVLGKDRPALQNFEKALAINPKLMDVFTNVIRVDAAQKEYDRALKRCDRQLKIVEDSPSAVAVIYNLKGNLYAEQNKTSAAEEYFQKAIDQDPDFLQPYYSLARIYMAGNKVEDAISKYEALLKANPKQTAPHMFLGMIYENRKQYDLSETHYLAALDIDSGFAPAANNLAYILVEQGKDLNEALDFARTAREKLPNEPYVIDTMGWVYYKKGLYDSAIGEFTESLAKLPENPTVNYHLGMAYYKKGDPEQARTFLEKALSISDSFDGAQEAKQVLAGL